MIILQQFNDREVLTFVEMLKLTNIPADDLRRHLISLAAPRYRILNKEPKSRLIEDDHTFSVNESFSSNSNRIRIPLVSVRSQLTKSDVPAATTNEIPPQVREDRKYLTEAAIVRIMKARKELKHNILVAETVKQLAPRFKPAPVDIKSRIESLLERDFIERDEDDQRLYRYVA